MIVTRFNLDVDFRIGPNDLLVAWRKWNDVDSLESFVESVEHATFYLKSEQAAGINRPKAWLLRQVSNGYYPPPAEFMSWEERAAEARLQAAQQKLQRMRELEEKQFDTDFEIWFRERTDQERREFLHRRVGMVLVHHEGQGIHQDEEEQHRQRDAHHGLEPLTKELDEFNDDHGEGGLGKDGLGELHEELGVESDHDRDGGRHAERNHHGRVRLLDGRPGLAFGGLAEEGVVDHRREVSGVEQGAHQQDHDDGD